MTMIQTGVHKGTNSVRSFGRAFLDRLGADSRHWPPYLAAIFTEAEHRSEMLLAYFRLAVFVILLVVLRVFDFFGSHHIVIFSIATYGVATGLTLLLAWLRFYRPWLPWAFTTLDVLLVLGFVVMLTTHAELSIAAAFSTAGGLMIFLFMAQAAVRYRPLLVLYVAALFLVGRIGFDLITFSATLEPSRPEWTVTQEWAQIAVTVLTAATLYVAVRRTRRLLLRSIQDAHLRTSISRFVPSVLVDELQRGGATISAPRSQRVAVLFVDIRGFTATCEHMPPSDVLDFLNEYRRRITAAVVTHGGTVDKFIGDAVMVIFGIPQPNPADAGGAIGCALAMHAAVEIWNSERAAAGLSPIRIGIGAHYGEAVVGAVGDEQRLEYTVIGDTVNTAQRLERLCAELDEPLLVSGPLLQAAGSTQTKFRQVSVQTVRGRKQPIEIHAPVMPLGGEAVTTRLARRRWSVRRSL